MTTKNRGGQATWWHMCQKEDDMSSYSEGQSHQLMDALEAKGFTPDHLTKLGQFKDLLLIREVLDGRAEIKPVEYLVDLDADPFVPKGWKVVEHRKGGQFKYDPAKVGLYLSKEQQKGKVIVGNDLRKELKNQSVMNTNLLDFYLKKENQHLIPEEWKGKAIFFWGTIYCGPNGSLCVRYLCWDGGGWDWNYNWLDFEFDGSRPAAVSAS
ncbi:MAG: hypothetical protein AAB674_00600 [Patescibacteria group bacterium]